MVDTKLEAFVTVFNIAHPTWEVNGNEDNELKPRHVDYDDNLRKYYGRCGPRQNGRVYYRVNGDYWEEWNWEKRIGLILHEIGHVEETNHTVRFWENVLEFSQNLIENINKVEEFILSVEEETTSTAKARQAIENTKEYGNSEISREEYNEEINDVLGGIVSVPDLKKEIVMDPITKTVDHRSETVYERRRKNAEYLNYPTEEIESFSGMNLYIKHKYGSDRVDTEKLDFRDCHDYAIDDLLTYLRSPHREGIKFNETKYVIEPLKVEEKEDGRFEVVDCPKKAAFVRKGILDKKNKNTIRVEIVR